MLKSYARIQAHLVTRNRDRGATAVEYGIMLALIAVAIVALVAGLGTRIAAAFTDITNGINNNAPR